MEKQLHYIFKAWLNSTTETNVKLVIKQLGKAVSTQQITVSEGTIAAPLMNAIEAFQGDFAIDIEVYSLTTLRKGKPMLVCCGMVYNEAKRAIAEYKLI